MDVKSFSRHGFTFSLIFHLKFFAFATWVASKRSMVPRRQGLVESYNEVWLGLGFFSFNFSH
jgi:hypothetical protein